MERKRNKLGKRLCSLLLILAMCTVMFPMSLWAKEGENTLPQEQSNTGSISGTIWLDKNEDGVYDSGESSVSGYEVLLYLASNTNDTVAEATTDSRGYYTFRDLEPNDYVVGIPLSQSVNGSQYLVSMIGISGNNKFVLDQTTCYAYTNTISVTAGTEAKDYSAGVRLTAGIQTLSVGIQPDSKTDYTVNNTVIGFAGNQWWVIGDANFGVASPDADRVTLLAKTKVFGTTQFNNFGNYNNNYKSSNLQNIMDNLYESGETYCLFTAAKDNIQEKEYVVTRESLDLLDETGSVAYDPVTNQNFWPLSYQEWGILNNDTIREYGDDYWLRTPDSAFTYVGWYGVKDGSSISNFWGNIVNSRGVRPAFYLDLSSVLFTSDASGTSSKSSTTTAGSATLADATSWSGDSTQPIKLTMEETDPNKLNLSTTTKEITAPPEETVTFNYDDAVIGTNKSVSVIICDQSTGEILYYGRPVDLSDSGAASSGTAAFKLPSGLALGNYTLKVFNEEVNGDNYTDYASSMIKIALRVQIPAKVEFNTTNVDKEVTLEFSDRSLRDEDTVNITTTNASDEETTFSKCDFTISYSNTEKSALNGFSVTVIGSALAGNTTLTIEEDYEITAGELNSAYLWYKDTCVGEFQIVRTYNTSAAIEDKSVTYDGTVQTIGDASVSMGYKGTVMYTYYTDDAYTTKTGAAGETASGAKVEGGAPKNAGTYYVIAEAAADGIYSNASDKAKLEITKLSITITANDQTITYGEALKADGYAVTGSLASNQSITAITLTPSGTTITDSGTITPSDATIQSDGGDNVTGNYTITYNTGTLVVEHDSSLAPEKITAVKTQTEYTAGDKLNTDDLTVTAFYEDGYSQEVIGYTTDASSINMDTAGQKKLTVSYTENGQTKIAEIAITVNAKPTYTVTVNNGTGGGSYEAGAVVTITAETPPVGKQFAGWRVDSINVTPRDTSSETTTFIMPAENVIVTAVYKDIQPEKYSITVQSDGNGTVEADMQTAESGTEVTLSYTANAGYHFKEWQVIEGDIRIEDSKFTMPAEDVTVKAIFEEDSAATYTVTVNNGSGSGSYEVGATVTITAEAPQDGKQFAGWRVDSKKVTLMDNSSETTTFTMPAEDVTVTAVYEDIQPEEYSITIQNDGNGTAKANMQTAAAGTEVTLSHTANEGYHFKEWQVAAGDIQIEDSKFTMPSENVIIKAIFEKDSETTYIVTVNNGSGSGSYEEGATVIITAEVPQDGKQFAGWTVDSKNVTLTDSISATTTFTMPAEAVTVTAEYTDVPTAEYSITVQSDSNGTAVADKQTATAGTEIKLSYTANAGYHFKEWQVVAGDIRIEDSKFTMPSENVTVMAIFEKDYTTAYMVTVNKGTGSGSYEEGETVTITAEAPPDRKQFTGWTVDSQNVTLMDSSSETTTFTMTAEDVTVTAIYEDMQPEEYSITIQNDGNGTAEANMQTAAAGTEVTLSYTANEGYHFKEWQVAAGDIQIEDSKFTMPPENVTVKAIFEKDSAYNPDVMYRIISGADGTWLKGSEKGHTITSDGDFSKFVSVHINGEVLDDKKYEVKEGSTVVTLSKEYLETLSLGTYEFKIEFVDGTAETTFTIAKAAETGQDNNSVEKGTSTAKSTATGDNAPVGMLLVLLVLSGSTCGYILFRKQKKNGNTIID